MNLTAPKSNIPIGWATFGGVRVPVMADAEWLRYLSQGLYDRVGGATGEGTNELTLSAFEDAGIEEAKASVFRLRDDMEQWPPLTPAAVESEPSLLGASAHMLSVGFRERTE